MGEMCRLCLSDKDVLIPIFYHGSVMPDNIGLCLGVQVSNGDCHKHICIACDGKLRSWRDFKLEIQSAQKFLNNQLSKTLHSKTVTSSGGSFSDDPCKSSIPRCDSGIRVKDCHSLSAEEFGNDQDFNTGAVTIKREDDRRSNLSSSRCSVQMMPGRFSTDPSSGSHLDVSSSSGTNHAFEAESVRSGRRASRSSTQSSIRNENQNYDSDECSIVDGPQKRKCEVVTLDKPEPKKRQKLSAGSAKQKKGTKVSSESNKSSSAASISKENIQQGGSEGLVKIQVATSKVSAPNKIGRQYIPCPYCSSTLQVYSLPTHIISQHKMDPSADDLETYINSQLSKASNPKGKSSQSMKMVVFPCNQCKNSYKTPFALKQHKKRFHVATSSTGVSKGGVKCICDLCKRRLASASLLQIHKQYCGTDRGIVCPFCSMCFENVHRLKRHIGQKHNDDNQVSSLSLQELEEMTRPVSQAQVPRPKIELSNLRSGHWKLRPHCPRCDDCTRLFHKEENLIEHQKYCGTLKAFKCLICPEQFKSSRAVTNHSMAMHNKVLYPCDFCNKKFTSKIEGEEHRKNHMILMKSKLYHKCRSCQNIFHGIAAWKNHKTNCKRFSVHKCEKCSFRFREATHFTIHKQQCTGKAPIEEKMDLSTRNIKCLQCMSKFDCETDFINHYVSSHVNAANSIYSGVNAFDCNFCYYGANNANSVAKHDSRCNGISFYVNKISESQVSPSKRKNSVGSEVDKNEKNSSPVKSSKSEIVKSLPPETKKAPAPIEIGKICSPSFMNEHLNASKNAQVIVEKLSVAAIHSASSQDNKDISDSSVPPKITPQRMTPSSKVNCQYCRRFFTPNGIAVHKCAKKKKILQKEYKKKCEQKKMIQKSEPSIRCELCNEMITHKALPDHLKVRHLAIKPVDMAESMIELSLMKFALTSAEVKTEASEVVNDEDSNCGSPPSDTNADGGRNSSLSLEPQDSVENGGAFQAKTEDDSDVENDCSNVRKEKESPNVSGSLNGDIEEEEEEEEEDDEEEEEEEEDRAADEGETKKTETEAEAEIEDVEETRDTEETGDIEETEDTEEEGSDKKWEDRAKMQDGETVPNEGEEEPAHHTSSGDSVENQPNDSPEAKDLNNVSTPPETATKIFDKCSPASLQTPPISSDNQCTTDTPPKHNSDLSATTTSSHHTSLESNSECLSVTNSSVNSDSDKLDGTTSDKPAVTTEPNLVT